MIVYANFLDSKILITPENNNIGPDEPIINDLIILHPGENLEGITYEQFAEKGDGQWKIENGNLQEVTDSDYVSE